ncbi:GNAT family N-acetyltransferase [Zhouia spongiae]|uniref:GNAT family N-acetyltransferase n=1 Tax=Zhouia spongiae TaxID=2202721 RepID=A0ABY3YRM5_9FLAO|nr:GNAT family N-acetyltransferase [Zhouia spongiae]UNZ00162.1 GNAT family N-acetyltransferase [Zhouia spongiae]
MPVKIKTYETERLILKPTDTGDAAFIFKLMNTPKFIKYIGDRGVNSIDAATAYIEERMTPQLKHLGYSNYTLIRKSDGKKAGTCGLYDREGLEGIDIGFAFLPEYEKTGYAYEASDKLKELAFTEFGIERLNAITTKDNFASQRLLEKLGLKYEGTVKLPDDREELLLYTYNATK